MEHPVSLYISKIPGFTSLGFQEQIRYLCYFQVKIDGKDFFRQRDVIALYDAAKLPKPASFSVFFSRLVNSETLLPRQNGYVINWTEFENLEKEFGASASKNKMSSDLRSLLKKMPDDAGKGFLQEAIICYESNARRAAIIMAWLLTLNHLQEYVVKHKLNEFNLALKLRYPKLSPVMSKDDFSDMKEAIFVELCKSAVVGKDVGRLLEEKLGFRHSCAHPSLLTISESKVTSYIEDVVDNVILKYLV